MSASQAPHATPGRSLNTATQKTAVDIGWLSHATYNVLPPRFQQAARELASKGELVIEDIPIIPGGR